MTAAALERPPARPGAASRARMLRAMLPALSLALVVIAIAWLNPRAISYFGFSLMLNLAIPIALATIAQMFVIASNEHTMPTAPTGPSPRVDCNSHTSKHNRLNTTVVDDAMMAGPARCNANAIASCLSSCLCSSSR